MRYIIRFDESAFNLIQKTETRPSVYLVVEPKSGHKIGTSREAEAATRFDDLHRADELAERWETSEAFRGYGPARVVELPVLSEKTESVKVAAPNVPPEVATDVSSKDATEGSGKVEYAFVLCYESRSRAYPDLFLYDDYGAGPRFTEKQSLAKNFSDHASAADMAERHPRSDRHHRAVRIMCIVVPPSSEVPEEDARFIVRYGPKSPHGRDAFLHLRAVGDPVFTFDMEIATVFKTHNNAADEASRFPHADRRHWSANVVSIDPVEPESPSPNLEDRYLFPGAWGTPLPRASYESKTPIEDWPDLKKIHDPRNEIEDFDRMALERIFNTRGGPEFIMKIFYRRLRTMLHGSRVRTETEIAKFVKGAADAYNGLDDSIEQESGEQEPEGNSEGWADVIVSDNMTIASLIRKLQECRPSQRILSQAVLPDGTVVHTKITGFILKHISDNPLVLQMRCDGDVFGGYQQG